MAVNKLFLDTSGLLCLLDASEVRHKTAAALFGSATPLVSTNYVLAEFVPLSMSRGFGRSEALTFLKDLVLLPRLDLVWVDESDAVSFVVMREGSIMEALTTDRHFEQEGFVGLLK